MSRLPGDGKAATEHRSRSSTADSPFRFRLSHQKILIALVPFLCRQLEDFFSFTLHISYFTHSSPLSSVYRVSIGFFSWAPDPFWAVPLTCH